MISNLTFGAYSISVSDQNGCFNTQSVYLSEKNTPIVEAEIINPDCNTSNGSINLSVTAMNGDNVLSTVWSNGQNTEDLIDVVKGYYVSIITTQNNCVAINGWTIENKLPDVQEICLVSVDSVTSTVFQFICF